MSVFALQGAGTALGELPPYFMAKAARLSGEEPDSEDYEEFEDMLEQDADGSNRVSIIVLRNEGGGGKSGK